MGTTRTKQAKKPHLCYCGTPISTACTGLNSGQATTPRKDSHTSAAAPPPLVEHAHRPEHWTGSNFTEDSHNTPATAQPPAQHVQPVDWTGSIPCDFQIITILEAKSQKVTTTSLLQHNHQRSARRAVQWTVNTTEKDSHTSATAAHLLVLFAQALAVCQ
eukprot:1138057-Pelagomonas_calceolata.AAC.6